LRDFLEVRELIPKYHPSADLYIAHAEGALQKDIDLFALSLRQKGINVCVDLSEKKVGDQLKRASKEGTKFSLVIGDAEITTKKFQLKNMNNGSTSSVTEQELITIIISQRN